MRQKKGQEKSFFWHFPPLLIAVINLSSEESQVQTEPLVFYLFFFFAEWERENRRDGKSFASSSLHGKLDQIEFSSTLPWLLRFHLENNSIKLHFNHNPMLLNQKQTEEELNEHSRNCNIKKTRASVPSRLSQTRNCVKYSHTSNYEANWRKFDFLVAFLLRPRQPSANTKCHFSRPPAWRAWWTRKKKSESALESFITLREKREAVMLHAVKYLSIAMQFPQVHKTERLLLYDDDVQFGGESWTWIELSSSSRALSHSSHQLLTWKIYNLQLNFKLQPLQPGGRTFKNTLRLVTYRMRLPRLWGWCRSEYYLWIINQINVLLGDVRRRRAQNWIN